MPLRVRHGGNPDEVEVRKFPIFLPHEILEEIAASEPHIIENCLLGKSGLDAVAAFWRQSATADWAVGHPVLQKPDTELQWTIPIEMFGDDASIWKDQKLLVMSWRSAVFKTTKTAWTSFLICCLPYAFVVTDITLHDLHSAIKWSFDCLIQGR